MNFSLSILSINYQKLPNLKTKGQLFLIGLILFLCSCNSFVPFYHGSINVDVPDGPPAFKAGYYDGCRSALSIRKMKNAAAVYKVKASGIHTNDPIYQKAWGNGWFTCYISSGTWTKFHPSHQSAIGK